MSSVKRGCTRGYQNIALCLTLPHLLHKHTRIKNANNSSKGLLIIILDKL